MGVGQMKIAMLPGSVSRRAGGLYTSVRRLSESIEKIPGAAVQVLGHFDDSTTEDVAAWKTSPQLLRSESGFRRVLELRQRLKTLSPDIVHPQFLWSYASVASVLGGYQSVISPRGMLDPWSLRQSKFKKAIAKSLFENRHFRKADCMHALCSAEALAIRAAGLKNPICVIPNGIDLPEFERHLNCKREKKITFVGRIHAKKGLQSLLTAWSLIHQQIADWKLVIAGWDDGGHLSVIQNQVANLGLNNSVHLAGSVYGEQKDQLLRSSSGFILPSFSEGLPMSVLEALAYKLPVLMTRECNLPEGFDCGAALRITTSPQDLANRLLDFTNLPTEVHQQMGQKGRRLVEHQFSWDSIASKMAEVYSWIAGAGDVPEQIMWSDVSKTVRRAA